MTEGLATRREACSSAVRSRSFSRAQRPVHVEFPGFVMNNGDFYGIEQMLVHPCYYREGSGEPESFYNELHPWRYHRLAEVFSTPVTPMTGVEVATHAELDALLERLADVQDPANRGPVLVQVILPREDYPRAIGYEVDEHCGPAPA